MTRRAVFLAVVATVAIGAGVWGLLRRAHDAGENSPLEDARAVSRPGLAGASPRETGRGAAHEDAGRPGTISGVVRRDGAPAAARVEALVYRGAIDRMRDPTGDWWGRPSEVDVDSFVPVSVATAEAGADGRYALEALPAGFYVVLARAADGGAGSVHALLRAGATVALDLDVWGAPAEETLRGRVLHGDGAPWRGTILVERTSVVEGSEPEHSPEPDRVTETSADGRFTVEGLRKGFVQVTAIADGSLRVVSRPVAIPFVGEYVLRLDAPTSAMSGRVVADANGGSVPGAVVDASLSEVDTSPESRVQDFHVRVTADAKGAFHVPVPVGNAVLEVNAQGFAKLRRAVNAGEARSGIEIRLPKCATLEGVVTAAEGGGPAAGARVRVVSIADGDRADLTTVADAMGRYRFPYVPAGDATVSVVGGGWMQEGAREGRFGRVELKAGAAAELPLRAIRAARAEGSVVNAEGGAVQGAVAECKLKEDAHQTWEPFDLERRMSLAVGADGSFSFEDLVPGASYVFTASAAGLAGEVSEPVKVSGDVAARIRIVLRAARWLTVTVRDAVTGAPIEGATARALTLVTIHEDGLSFQRETGRDGTARVGPFPEGRPLELRAVAWHPDYYLDRGDDADPHQDAYQEGPAYQVDGQDRAGDMAKEFRLTRGLSIEGRLVIPDGPSPDRIEVGIGHAGEDGSHGGGSVSAFRDDPLGPYTFHFRGLRPGRYRLAIGLWAQERKLRGSMRVAAGTTGVEFRVIADEPILLVHVLDASGKPVSGADVGLWDPSSPGEEVAHAETREDGPARLWPGDLRGVAGLWIEAHEATDSRGTRTGLGPSRLGPLGAGTKEVTIRLEPGRRIEGRLVLTDGHGLGGVEVEADSVPSPGTPVGAAVHGRAETSRQNGSFTIDGLGDGEYRVGLYQELDDYFPGDPVVARGGATGVRVVLVPAVEAKVTVLDGPGRPLAGATVSLSSLDAYAHPSAETDETGTAVLKKLNPRLVWEFRVLPPKGREDLSSLVRKGWQPHDETVTMSPGFEISGHLVDGAGRPLANEVVWAESVTGRHYAKADESGAFRHTGVPAGDVRLVVRFSEDVEGEPPRAEAVVPAGTRDVKLVADSGLGLVVRVLDAPAGPHSNHWMRLCDRPPGALEAREQAIEVKDGMAAFTGLRAGVSYSLWWPLPGQGLVAFMPAVAAGGTIDVRLVPSKTLSGTVRLPPHAENASVWLRLANIAVSAWMDEDGYFEVGGLPDGTWTVEATASVRSVEYIGTAEAVAGSEVVIDLHRK